MKQRRSIKYPKLNDKKWLEHKLFEEKLTLKKISKELKCSEATVNNMVNTHKIISPRHHFRGIPELDNKKWLKQKYVTENIPIYKIAKLLHTYARRVSDALRLHDIKITGHLKCRMLKEKFWLDNCYRMYNTVKMGKELGVIPNTVRSALLRHNIKLRGKGLYPRNKNYMVMRNKNWLMKKYLGEDMTAQSIAESLGCTMPNVQYWLSKYKIKRK